jgi:hypothetical protein
MAEALGCYAEFVDEPKDIRPALQRAWKKPALQRAWKKVEEGMVARVDVKSGYRARAMTVASRTAPGGDGSGHPLLQSLNEAFRVGALRFSARISD